MSQMDTYRAGTGAIPPRMLKWHLYGKGLESLRCEEVDVPEVAPDQLLVRQDAVGLCFSDTKVIALGNEHPRMVGRDLSTDPATLGHEVAITVVKIGSDLVGRFSIGDRFIVQADVFYKGVSMAYGYVISGGLSQYSIIPISMIDGDEGCYLLPIQPGTGYAATALVEPWACVVGAYNQSHRDAPLPGGRLLLLGGQDAVADWTGAYPTEGPSAVVTAGAAVIAGPSAATGSLGTTPDWAAAKANGEQFDDIVVSGAVSPEDAEGAATLLANHGVMSFVGNVDMPRKLSLDVGRVHYNWHHYLGTGGATVVNAYAEPRGADLLEGGAAWFIGAGGPMGQMHVQRAVMHPRPPKLIVGTDIDGERLQTVVDRLSGIAAERGVTLVTLNPKEMTPEQFAEKLTDLTGGVGFDDIISLVPVPALIEHATDFLANDAWFNVFAGVARGTMARIDVNDIRTRGVRYIGSSGSSIADMRETLAMVESGELSTNASLAAIGGMKAAQEGLGGVKEGRFPGKTLVFPFIPDMPLMALSELRDAFPTVYAKMKDGKFWTKEAEDELLSLTAAKE